MFRLQHQAAPYPRVPRASRPAPDRRLTATVLWSMVALWSSGGWVLAWRSALVSAPRSASLRGVSRSGSHWAPALALPSALFLVANADTGGQGSSSELPSIAGSADLS